MKLNHVNLAVTDVGSAGAFLERYFGLEFRGVDGAMGFLVDDDEFVVTLTETNSNDERLYPGFFHVGFFVDDKALVDETHAQLRRDAYDVTELKDRQHSYGFYVDAPGGFTVEMGA